MLVWFSWFRLSPFQKEIPLQKESSHVRMGVGMVEALKVLPYRGKIPHKWEIRSVSDFLGSGCPPSKRKVPLPKESSRVRVGVGMVE